MSRLIVKNLPKHFNEKRMKEHFGQKGDVTDVKIMLTPEGVSRHFGFVGFRNEKDCEAAAQFFNRTFIDTSRISVQLARPVGSIELERPWSKYSKGSSKFQKVAEKDENRTGDEKAEKQNSKKRSKYEEYQDKLKNPDGELKEFLDVMKPRHSAKVWANDDTFDGQTVDQNKRQKKNDGMVVEKKSVASRKFGGENTVLVKEHAHFVDSDSDDELYDDIPAKEGGATAMDEDSPAEKGGDKEEEEGDKAANDPGMSDMDYLRSKMKKASSDSDKESDGDSSDSDSDSDDDGEKVKKAGEGSGSESEGDSSSGSDDGSAASGDKKSDKKSETKAKDAKDAKGDGKADADGDEDIGESGRLFVRNLAFSATEEDLFALFKRFGDVAEVHIPIDKMTKRPRGIAYVLYVLPECAVKAFNKLDNTSFQGRLLHILPAKKREEKKAETEEGAKQKSSFAKQKEEKMRAMAGSEHNWNSLFMRSDAVVDSLADRYGMKKSEILDRDAESMAVRVALGETHVIAETKKYLEENGVSLEALNDHSNKKKERSRTEILVKNIPHVTEEEELRKLFGKYGQLGRVLVPPAKTTALIEFNEASEARSAFRGLAYRGFHHVPLFLEWAPVGLFSAAAAAGGDAKEAAGDNDDQEEDAGQAATVYVKNLSFATREEDLKKAFAKCSGMKSCTVALKKDPKNVGQMLSMGYGFVEFSSKEHAINAVKHNQGMSVDRHALTLKLSGRGAAPATTSKPASTSKPKKTSTTKQTAKLMIRNVPFEATKKELRQLFAAFGQLKSLRIPKKFDGTHRGFAFVDFLTKQEAKNAFDALQSTHLYGRHLVIEYSTEANPEDRPE